MKSYIFLIEINLYNRMAWLGWNEKKKNVTKKLILNFRQQFHDVDLCVDCRLFVLVDLIYPNPVRVV
jgi:hypothetical protein